MKSHKIVFIGCILVSIILFIDGISILSYMSGRIDHMSKDKLNNIYGNGISGDSSTAYERPVNMVVLGLDEEEARSDVIMLLNFCPVEGKLNILFIARDTKVYENGKAYKINALIGKGGASLASKKIEEITGLTADYYLVLNFTGFKKIIDILGGVQVNIPFDMDYDDPDQNLHIHLKKGAQILNGEKAEHYVRYRKGNRLGQGYTDGDLGRISAQQQLIRALLNQKMKLKYLSKIDDIFFILRKYMNTNIELSDINRYIGALRNMKHEKTLTFMLPGRSAYMNGIWYFIYDKGKTHEIINANFFCK